MKNKNISLDNLKQLVHGAGIVFLFGIFGYLFSFLFKIIIARYFGPENFGIYTLTMTLLGMGVLFAGLGISVGIPRYIPLYKHSKEKKLLSGYINFIFKTLIFSSVFFSFFIFIFAENITNFFNFPIEFSLFLKIIAWVIPVKIIKKTIRSIFVAEKKIMYPQFTNNIVEKFLLVLGAIIIWHLNFGIIHLIILMALTTLLTLFFDIYFYKTKINLDISKKGTYRIKEWIYFSIPLLFTSIFAYLISWTDNLVIGKFLEPTDLGIYSIAYSLAIALVFFQDIFGALFLPLISENYAKKKYSEITFLFKKSSAWVFGLTFPVFLIMAMYSKDILNIFYGASFELGYLPLMIIAFGLLIGISTGMSNQILILHKKTKLIFWVNIVIATFNLILNIVLIPLIGIIGAAITSAASFVLQKFILLIFASKYEKIRFDWFYNLKFIIAGIPSILFAALFFRIGLHILIAVIGSLIVYSWVYLLLLLLLRTFTKEDFQIVLAIEKKFGIDLKFLKQIVRGFY